jgi:hypothetical protein
MSTLTLKIATLYAACSPDFGVVSYGGCQDEALNNLTDEIRDRQGAGKTRTSELAREGNSHV